MRKDNKTGVLRKDPNYHKEYRKTHPWTQRNADKRWYEKHKDVKITNTTKYMRLYRKEHPEARTESIWKKRKRIFDLLGGKCHSCGESDWRCLQIDHVHGGGNKQKKMLKSSNEKYYNLVLKMLESGSKDYQLLCANCNWKKLYDNNELSTNHMTTILKVMSAK
jgi:hypothetical protein